MLIFHCKSIPYSVVESTWFEKFLKRLGVLVVISIFLVRRILEVRLHISCLTFLFILANKLSCDLLDINFQEIYEGNKITTTENANVLGLSWSGGGATIERMSLLIMFTICKSKPPSVTAILDCTGHLVDGVKKDAEFIMSFFKSKVDEFDIGKHLLNLSCLMGQEMLGKWGEFCVQIYHRQCVSIEGNIFYQYSLVTCQKSGQ